MMEPYRRSYGARRRMPTTGLGIPYHFVSTSLPITLITDWTRKMEMR